MSDQERVCECGRTGLHESLWRSVWDGERWVWLCPACFSDFQYAEATSGHPADAVDDDEADQQELDDR